MAKKFNQLNLMVKWEDEGLSEEEEKRLFQRLVDTGLAWRLKGMYGREAQALLDAGIIHYPKKHHGQNATDFYGNQIPTDAQHKKRMKER